MTSSAITSSLTQSVPSASRAELGGQHRLGAGEAAGGVGQHGDLVPVQHVEHRPGRAGSIRRIATVVSSVPEASSAASITSRLGAPPVPMISREPNDRPAMQSRSSPCSATLHRRDDLHPGALAEHGVGLPAPRHDLAVDGDRDAPRGVRVPARGQDVDQPDRRRQLSGLAVDVR